MGGFEFGFDAVKATNNGFQVGNNDRTFSTDSVKKVDYGFSVDEVGDVANFSTNPVKSAFSQMDLDYMYELAGISKPDSVKSLENTIAFMSEGAEYGVEYSDDDMNLARFMFENMYKS